MKKIVVLLMIATLALFMLSCDKSSSPASKKPFSLKIKLVNSENEPLSGYGAKINPVLNMPGKQYSADRSEVTIAYSIPKRATVKVEIYDYFDNKVTTLVDDLIEGGSHALVYAGDSNFGDGIYKAILTIRDDESITNTLSCNLYQYSPTILDHNNYETDELGEIEETNRLPFPYLYFKEEFKCIDDWANIIGNLVFTAETCVKISNPDGVMKTATFNISEGENVLALNWDEMTLDDGITANAQPSKLDRDNEESPIQARIYAYPNPFN